VSDDIPYEQVTEGIRIRVSPEYSDEQSTPEEAYFFWIYTVEIANESEHSIQLKSRLWRITDANGKTDEIRGPGVVGQTPVIPPGQSFTYSSGCPLSTASGIMVGSYQMIDEGGRLFYVAIPAFSLDSPYDAMRRVN
jgi:ApaG protein